MEGRRNPSRASRRAASKVDYAEDSSGSDSIAVASTGSAVQTRRSDKAKSPKAHLKSSRGSSDSEFVISPADAEQDASDDSPDESGSSSDAAAPPSPLPTAAPEEVEYVKQASRKSKSGTRTKQGTDEVERRRVSARGKARVRQKRDVLTVSGRAETSDSSIMSGVTDSVGKKSGGASSKNAPPLKTSRPSTPKGRAEKDNWALILRAKDRVRKLVREKQAEEAKRGQEKLPARDNGNTDSPAHVREVLDELGDEETARLYYVKIEMGKEKYERDQKLFTVIATGARPGELLRGIRDKTRNVVVRVNTLIRPSARRLLTIHHSASAWALFLKKLGQVAFFHPLSLDERSDWLVQHAITEDYDLADVPGLTLDFSSLGSGSSAFLTRSEPQMELMLTKSESGEGISPVEVLGMFQNKPGSKGLRGRPTLVFLRQYWKVESTHIEVEVFSGVCVSVADGRVIQGAQISPVQKPDPKRGAKHRVRDMSTTSNSDSQSYSVTQNGTEGQRLGIRTPDMNVCEDVTKATMNGPGQSLQIKDASCDTILLFSGFEKDEGATHPTANKRFKADNKLTTKASKKKRQRKSADEAAAEMSGTESAAGDNSDDPIPDATTQQTVGFIVSKRNLPLSQSEALEAADVSEEDFLRIKPSLRGFTAAGYKSLLQKIIRARPSQIELLDGQRLDSGLVLRTTVMLLFLHAGAFVPDIQRYVTGAESALKRVAVCVLEDSYTPDHQSLLSLLAAAWVAQASARLWRPGKVQLSQAVAVAMQAWQNEDKFKWSHISESDSNKRKPSNKRTLREYVLSSSNTALANCSAMLDRLRSFQGDLLMAREIAVNKGFKIVCRGTSTGPQPQPLQYMSVLHAVDQHWCPDFVYFFPPDITTQLKTQTKSAAGTGKGSSCDAITHSQSPTSTPFKDVFSQVAQQSGGVNTRLASFDPLSAFNVHVRRAQKLALLALSRGTQVQRSVGDKTLEQEYELDQAWIAGLVGAIEVTLTKPSTAALVTLRPDDPRQLVAFRRPSRDSARKAGGSESGLTDIQEEQAKTLARAILSAGVKLDKSAAPMAQLKGAMLYYQTVDQIPHFERRLIEPVAADIVDSDIDLAAAEHTGPSERDTNLVVNGNADEDATYIYNTLTCEVMDASVPESEFARYVIKSTDDSAAFEGDWEVLRKGITHTYPVHPTLGMEKEPHSSIATKIEQVKVEGAIAEPDLEPDSTNVDGKEDLDLDLDLDPDLDRVLLGLTTTGAGVEADAKRKTSRLLRNTRTQYITRAFSIASAFSATFAFPRISRDGGGTEQQPSPDDIGAFQFMLKLSTLYPGMLQWSGGQIPSFTVVVGPGFWKLRRDCLAEVASVEDAQIARTQSTYPNFTDSRNSTRGYQKDAVNEMISQHRNGRRGNFLYLPVGLGKTKIVMDYASWLQSEGKLPRTILWTLPSSALESVRQEMRFYGLPVRILWPLKRPFPVTGGATAPKNRTGALRSPAKASSDYYRGDSLLDGAVNFIAHDHLRLCHESHVGGDVAGDLLFVVDEVHKALNASQRTASALEIARRAKGFVALTGTPIIDNNTYKLMWWLEHIVPFEVNTRNFWAAAGAMVSKRIALGILTETRLIEGTFTTTEGIAYHALVSPALGGMNSSFTEKHFRLAMQLCYRTVSRDMVEETKRLVHSEKEKVMLVAKDATHQARLVAMLTTNGNGLNGVQKAILSTKVFCITAQASVNYTPLTKNKHSYDVVVTTMRHVEGYSLTAMHHMVTSVYPSNNAAREQLEGRMVRLGQPSGYVYFHVVCIGLLHNIRRSHEEARSLSDVLKSLATVVEAPPPSATG